MPRSSRGFTIAELLVVIVVIGILSSVTIVAYNGAQLRAQQARLLSDVSTLTTKIELFNSELTAYPTAINDCPNPTASNMCVTPPSDQTFTYRTNPTGNFTITPLTTNNLAPSYDIYVLGTKGGIYVSNAKRTSAYGNEFLQYGDLAPLIDSYGLKKYILSFDIKSANTALKSTVLVYFQNGSTSRHGGLSQNVNVSTTYQHYDLEFTASLTDAAATASILAFYGTYSTGNIPSVKNVEVMLAQ